MELLGKVGVHGKVIEKILHGGRVLGIVPFGGAGVTIGRTFELAFALTI